MPTSKKMIKEPLIKSFDKFSTLWGIKTNGKLLIPFVVSLSNHELNKLVQRFLKYIGALLLILAITGFSAVFAETSEENAPSAPKKLNLSGLYLGFFPCDDCHGIKTTLALNKSGTYVFITQYVGKSEREFVEKGKYALADTGDKIILTPKKGSTTEQQYLIDDNMLIKLDENGERITQDNADRYILHRKDVIGSPEQHSGH